ncbi:hypothetical protein SAMN05421636_10471 [Pricia antarctica]|uniref:Uncharacterized protein n=1 Tax=Pricia antarctica TaxID=641691 RepID=A0A1G7BC93_9FLAO|nr:hypothetical protein [Pricia antarctica]SDE23956.1 hypothetical protein SAMN05421636_10471 [Pricia antarctica]
MFTTGKKSKIVSVFGRCLRMLLILGTIVICIEACSKDEEEIKKESPPIAKPPGEGNQGGGQDTIVAPADSLEADVIAQYLKLVNATKIPGQPPSGGDGAIWNNVKDSIYLMRGLPVGDRVRFLHDPAINVTGFYVYVPGASYYYDVPIVPEESTDSTDVVNIDAEFPVADFKDYPISFPLQLMPYVDGIPFSTFIEPVEIDDPNDPDEADVCNSILREAQNFTSHEKIWQWEFTIHLYNDEILQVKAPGRKVALNKNLGGCCNNLTGQSVLAGSGGGGCKKNNPAPNLTWVEFNPHDGRTDLRENLFIYDNGRFQTAGKLDEAAIIPSTRNFCDSTVTLAYNIFDFHHNGNHDFTPGTNTMNLTFDPYQGSGPVSFLNQNTYELQYTCHQLILTRKDGEGGEWGFVYKKYVDDKSNFELEWYDNRDNPYIVTH